MLHCCTSHCVTGGSLLLQKVSIKLLSLLIRNLHSLYTCRRNSSNKQNDVTTLAGVGQVYEDPDKMATAGQGNYELTQCPAYESSKPLTQQAQSSTSYYEI